MRSNRNPTRLTLPRLHLISAPPVFYRLAFPQPVSQARTRCISAQHHSPHGRSASKRKQAETPAASCASRGSHPCPPLSPALCLFIRIRSPHPRLLRTYTAPVPRQQSSRNPTLLLFSSAHGRLPLKLSLCLVLCLVLDHGFPVLLTILPTPRIHQPPKNSRHNRCKRIPFLCLRTRVSCRRPFP